MSGSLRVTRNTERVRGSLGNNNLFIIIFFLILFKIQKKIIENEIKFLDWFLCLLGEKKNPRIFFKINLSKIERERENERAERMRERER